jgi:hypothetical protein
MVAKRAVEVAQRMPDAFLADVSALLEPRRATAVIAAMPAPRVVAVARILAERDGPVTLARFGGYLPAATIRAVIDAIADDEALLRTAFFLESKSALDRLASLVPRERLGRVVALVAGAGDELWAEALSLMTHVSEPWQRHIGDLAAEQDDDALMAMITATQRFELWPAVLPLFAAMSEATQRRFMGLPLARVPGLVPAIVAAADATDAWARLIPLVLHMGDEMRSQIAAALEEIAPQLSEAARAELEGTLRALAAEYG